MSAIPDSYCEKLDLQSFPDFLEWLLKPLTIFCVKVTYLLKVLFSLLSFSWKNRFISRPFFLLLSSFRLSLSYVWLVWVVILLSYVLLWIMWSDFWIDVPHFAILASHLKDTNVTVEIVCLRVKSGKWGQAWHENSNIRKSEMLRFAAADGLRFIWMWNNMIKLCFFVYLFFFILGLRLGFPGSVVRLPCLNLNKKYTDFFFLCLFTVCDQ